MKNILQEIAEYTRERIEKKKAEVPLRDIRKAAHETGKGSFSFERALRKPGISFICECKKASPSKGLIAPDFPYLNIASEYEEGGADAVSVLTEPKWFLGDDSYAEEIAKKISLPVLRKDFTVDEYMIYEAKVLGAAAVLLIVSILEKEELKEYLSLCKELGLSALVETHDEKEIETAVDIGAGIIGVNNRNLTDFSVDTELSLRLRSLIPKDRVYVSESGIRSRDDIIEAERAGADAVLIGEALMRSENKAAAIRHLKGEG